MHNFTKQKLHKAEPCAHAHAHALTRSRVFAWPSLHSSSLSLSQYLESFGTRIQPADKPVDSNKVRQPPNHSTSHQLETAALISPTLDDRSDIS